MTIRCFLCVEPDDAARDALREAARMIDAPAMRHTPADQLHLTVKFLGDVLHEQADRFVEGLRDATADLAAFHLTDPFWQAIPNARRPRVAAVGFEPTAAAYDLHEIVEMVGEDANLAREGRPFRPHVTLGRFNARRRPPRDFAMPADPPPAIDWCVDALVLKRSELTGTGAVHHDVARVPLGA